MRCSHSAAFSPAARAPLPQHVGQNRNTIVKALEEIDPNTGLPFENASTRTVQPR